MKKIALFSMMMSSNVLKSLMSVSKINTIHKICSCFNPALIASCNHTFIRNCSQVTAKRNFNNDYDMNKNDIDPFVCLKIIRLLKKAIRDQGPIIEENKKLSYLLKQAQKYNIPYDFIDHAQKSAIDTRSRIGICELLYLNHGLFVVQYEDIDISNTKHHLLNLCDNYDAYYISGAGVRWPNYFNLKGILTVEGQNILPFSNEKEAQEIAAKTGAKSVRKEIDFDGWVSWQFLCEPGELHKVKRKLQDENYEVEEAYVGFIPKRNVPLPGPAKRNARDIITAINKLPAIDNIYHNILL